MKPKTWYVRAWQWCAWAVTRSVAAYNEWKRAAKSKRKAPGWLRPVD
jgi:hypothetical protein